TIDDFIEMKLKTYDLLKQLQFSMNSGFIDSMNNIIDNSGDNPTMKDFFGSAEQMQEPIFYSGTGAYDFQLMDGIKSKYHRDSKWLLKNRSYNVDKIPNVFFTIKDFMQKKARKVNAYFTDKEPEFKAM